MSLIRNRKILIILIFIILAHFVYVALDGFNSLEKNGEMIHKGFESGAHELKEDEIINYATIIKGEIYRKIHAGDPVSSIIDFIKNVKFGSNGYAFAYDSHAIRLASGDTNKNIGKSYWKVKDSNGKPVIQDLIRNAKSGKLEIYEYYFPKPGTNQPHLKMSTSFYVEEYDMIVGTGLYYDDSNILINNAFREHVAYTVQKTKSKIQVHVLFLLMALTVAFLGLIHRKSKPEKKHSKSEKDE